MMPILINHSHPLRNMAEAMIREVYLTQYNATISEFSDLLIAMPDENGGLKAVAGLRVGGGFFSEIYLDRPIEAELSKYWTPPAERHQIAEVTTLAATHPSALHQLFAGIIGYLRTIGMRFAFFTVTERLYSVLRRSGAPAQELAMATADRISNPEAWGTYYASNPRVVAIHDSFVTMRGTVPFGVAGGEAANANNNRTADIA